MKLPKATKYEVLSSAGLYETVDAGDAISHAAQRDGVIYAVTGGVCRVAGAYVLGVPLSAKQYRQYLDLSDGGAVRELVDAKGVQL